MPEAAPAHGHMGLTGSVRATRSRRAIATAGPPRADTPVDLVLTAQRRYALMTGDSLEVLRQFPSQSIHCVVTSPPYFNQREYDVSSNGGFVAIGNEASVNEYVDSLVRIFDEVRRVLVDTGSLWLNLGDKFIDKELVGVPWRVALALKDNGWKLRQDIIWNQLKGTQSAKDRMRNIHEHVFHFVKRKSYYFDGNQVRIKPGNTVRVNGRIKSATGVTGAKYYRQIADSRVLSAEQKTNAKRALDETIREMEQGKIADFRMTIRGVQRIYHSDNGKVSGRARELESRGYFILKMSAKGFLPSSVWAMVPEDEWRKDSHCAVFPKELVRIPLLCTCPANGVALDPFSGTGTTVATALDLGMRGIGIDISASYTRLAAARLAADAVEA